MKTGIFFVSPIPLLIWVGLCFSVFQTAIWPIVPKVTEDYRMVYGIMISIEVGYCSIDIHMGFEFQNENFLTWWFYFCGYKYIRVYIDGCFAKYFFQHSQE